jgi:hypothetical protein
VGAAFVGRAAAPPRLRRPRTGPLVGPHRALPAVVRRGQHDDRLPLDPGVPLPPVAPSGLRPPASPAHRVRPQVDAAAQGRRRRCRRTSRPAASARCCPTPVARRRRGHPRASWRRARSSGSWRPSVTSSVTRAPPCCASSSWPRLRPRSSPQPYGDTPTPSWCGSRTSRRTRARGRSWRSTCRSCWPSRARTARCASSPARPRPRRPLGSHKKHELEQAALLGAAFAR